jgi:hypothetical protein
MNKSEVIGRLIYKAEKRWERGEKYVDKAVYARVQKSLCKGWEREKVVVGDDMHSKWSTRR